MLLSQLSQLACCTDGLTLCIVIMWLAAVWQCVSTFFFLMPTCKKWHGCMFLFRGNERTFGSCTGCEFMVKSECKDLDVRETEWYEATPTPMTVTRILCTEKKNTCLNLLSFVFYVKEEKQDGLCWCTYNIYRQFLCTLPTIIIRSHVYKNTYLLWKL